MPNGQYRAQRNIRHTVGLCAIFDSSISSMISVSTSPLDTGIVVDRLNIVDTAAAVIDIEQPVHPDELRG